MNRNSLFAELKKHPWILAVVIIGHVALAILLSVNLAHDDKPPVPSAKKHNIIDAVVVDAKAFDDRKKQKELEQKRKRDQALKKKQEEENKRKQEQARKKAEADRAREKKKAEERKRAEQKQKQEQLKREKELAIAKKKEQDRLKQEKLKKQRLEQERLEKERLAKLEAERQAEIKRKEEARRKEEQRRKAEERRRAEEKAEMERALLEEERRREEAARQAERAARLQTMRDQYILMIAQDVENSWIRPVSSRQGQSCEVIVTQASSGDVIDVRVQSCDSTDTFRESVKRAVMRASPLPLPPDPELFERQIHFTFKPRT